MSLQATTHFRFLRSPLTLALAGSSLLGSPLLHAQDASSAEARLPVIMVVGESRQDIMRQPGAVTLVTLEELRIKQPRSTEEMLRGVPGVSHQTGGRNAPSSPISACAASVRADYKTLILEDGVPIALQASSSVMVAITTRVSSAWTASKCCACSRFAALWPEHDRRRYQLHYAAAATMASQVSLRTGTFGTREATVDWAAAPLSNDDCIRR
jgi:hypothetical protein